MPRDGSGQYGLPFPDVVEGTTIESTVYNGFTNDVAQDLNAPRPIVAGGTGANNAHDAMVNLKGEVALQVVDNYDTFPFVDGSFSSQPSATNRPPSPTGYVAGVAYGSGLSAMMLEARDLGGAPTVKWVRSKVGGVWSAWSQENIGSLADTDAHYVNVSGDTMTGSLTAPSIALNTATAAGKPIYGTVAGLARWEMDFGDGGPESGGNAGSDFFLRRFSDAGTQIGLPLNINRATGDIVTDSHFKSAASVTAGHGGAVGTYYFGGSGTKVLNFDGAGFNFVGGPVSASGGRHLFAGGSETYVLALRYVVSGTPVYIGASNGNPSDFIVSNAGGGELLRVKGDETGTSARGSLTAVNVKAVGGDVHTSRSPSEGVLFFGDGTKYIHYTGGNFQFVNGPVVSDRGLWVEPPGGYFGLDKNTTNNYFRWNPTNYTIFSRDTGAVNTFINTTHFMTWRHSDYAFILNSSGNAYKAGGGAWGDTSDSRIKNVLGDYTRGLDEVAALRPVYYTFKGNDTEAPPAHHKSGIPETDDKSADVPLAVPYPNSAHKAAAEAGTRYAGLIAQEVEAIFPEMVTKRSGYIDGEAVTDLRDLNTSPLVFALVNAVKELKEQIDGLRAELRAK